MTNGHNLTPDINTIGVIGAGQMGGGIAHVCALAGYAVKLSDVSEEALRVDKKAATILAAVGIPVALFLHGYAGFIFGSVKANALWMSPLMPVIFIMSAVVSGIALCMLTYIAIMEWRAFRSRRSCAREATRSTATSGAAARSRLRCGPS